jgi:hypothetical protein
MKLALAFCLAATPVLAQETAPETVPPAADDDGFSLMEEGAKLLFRGLMTEMQPAIDEMGKALDEMGPALEGLGEEIGPKIRQLIAMIDDIKNYDAPIMLPNGDILIRRKADAPPAPPFGVPTPSPETAPRPAPEIEL